MQYNVKCKCIIFCKKTSKNIKMHKLGQKRQIAQNVANSTFSNKENMKHKMLCWGFCICNRVSNLLDSFDETRIIEVKLKHIRKKTMKYKFLSPSRGNRAFVSISPFDCIRVSVERVNVEIPKYRGIEADKKNLVRDWRNVVCRPARKHPSTE